MFGAPNNRSLQALTCKSYLARGNSHFEGLETTPLMAAEGDVSCVETNHISSSRIHHTWPTCMCRGSRIPDRAVSVQLLNLFGMLGSVAPPHTPQKAKNDNSNNVTENRACCAKKVLRFN